MEILDLQQGSPEWNAERLRCFTASEAPVMMADSKNMRRSELLSLKHSGNEREYSDWVQRHLFDKGHEAEAAIRPHIEQLIGEELYPVTGKSIIEGLPLLASFDGLTMLGDVVFEHKLWNEELARQVEAFNDGNGDLDPHYLWQLQQQMLVGGATKAIFVVSDGKMDNAVYCWVDATDTAQASLIAGWKQFAQDLKNYQPPEAEPVVVGSAPNSLPALRIELQGAVTASNLPEFKATALAVIGAINTDLQTDEHFADAEKTVKWCGEVENKLDAAKQHALSQTATIDELFRAIDEIREETRQKRLQLEKLVKARKTEIRDQIAMSAREKLRDHVAKVEQGLQGYRLPAIDCNIAGSMKGKKTISSLRDAANDAVTKAMIIASETGRAMTANLLELPSVAGEYAERVTGVQQLIEKAPEDFEAAVALQIVRLKEADQAAVERAERLKEAQERDEKQQSSLDEHTSAYVRSVAKEESLREFSRVVGSTPPEMYPSEGEKPELPPGWVHFSELEREIESRTVALIDAYIAQAGMADRTAVTVRKHLEAFVQFAREQREAA